MVRTKAFPLWIDTPDYGDTDALRRQLQQGIASFAERYSAYVKKYSRRLPHACPGGFDPLPRVVLLPGLGAVCAGRDIAMATAVRDITEQTL